MPHRRSWHSSPPLLSPPLLIILFPIVTITVLFLTVPPLLSAATTRLISPASVKTSWDSLNILLVVFAILCGVFARRNDDEPSTTNNDNNHHDVPDRNAAFRQVPSEESQSQWYGFSEERKVYNNEDSNNNNRFQSPATGVNRLRMRRNSSSYPDLRQWETADDRYKFRFFDDFEIDKQFRSPAREHFSAVDHRKRWPESPPPRPSTSPPQQEEEDRVKEIPVDTFEIRHSPPPVKSTTPPPPPPPRPESAHRNARRTNQKIERHESEITIELDDRDFMTIRSPPPAPQTPAPAPSVKSRSERKSERKKSNVKREIAMVWASVLSNQRKKKKKQRTKNNLDHPYDDNVDELTNNTTAPPATPPPPPPPPPPPSVFHSFFRKGLGKSKKIHSVSPPPPPPPPPPSKRKNRIPPPPSPPPDPPRRRNHGRPPLPSRTVNFNDEALNSGNQSPLIPVPPPPPPPFNMTAMKFVVRGDYVKIRSNQSSRCSSPEREDINVSETAINDAVRDRNGNVDSSVFCPSPDVNVKAASFIARLRGEWKLEKLNSLKEKGNASLLHRL